MVRYLLRIMFDTHAANLLLSKCFLYAFQVGFSTADSIVTANKANCSCPIGLSEICGHVTGDFEWHEKHDQLKQSIPDVLVLAATRDKPRWCLLNSDLCHMGQS